MNPNATEAPRLEIGDVRHRFQNGIYNALTIRRIDYCGEDGDIADAMVDVSVECHCEGCQRARDDMMCAVDDKVERLDGMALLTETYQTMQAAGRSFARALGPNIIQAERTLEMYKEQLRRVYAHMKTLNPPPDEDPSAVIQASVYSEAGVPLQQR